MIGNINIFNISIKLSVLYKDDSSLIISKDNNNLKVL